jgi:hypothetical protein
MAIRRRHLAAVLLATALAACTSDPAGIDPAAPILTRRDAEPAGAHCASGGTAVRVGRDLDGDGVLADAEVEHTDYVCAGAPDGPPPTLVREDPIAPGAACADGGTAINVGLDDNRDGVLADTEIDQTTTVCEVAEIWEGDFTGDWSDPATAATLAHVRIVTGSLSINSATPVTLPALELVGGSLTLGGNMSAVGLPALTRIGGDVTIDTPGIDAFSLPVVAQVGGSFLVTGNGIHGTQIAAPALTAIGRDLILWWGARGALVMPQLHDIGHNLDLSGALTSLDLGHLSTIGGDLHFDDTALTEVRIPAVTAIGGKVSAYAQARLALIDLPMLTNLGGLWLSHLDGLATVRMPALASISDAVQIDTVAALATIDLEALTTVGGAFVILDADALQTLAVPALRQVGGGDHVGDIGLELAHVGLTDLDLPALTTIGNLDLDANPAMRAIRLPALTTATGLNIGDSPVLTTVIASAITHVAYVNLAGNPALASLDLHALNTITDHLDLRDAPLTDLRGFAGLASARMVQLSALPTITSLHGLEALTAIAALEVHANPALTSLDGLEHVRQLSSWLRIESNPHLASIAGLAGLTHVGDTLSITDAPALISLAGLDHLQSINGGLELRSVGLTSLGDLAALGWIGGAITIQFDSALSADEIAAFKARLAH